MQKPIFAKGYRLEGPDNQGYELTRDFHPYDFVLASDWEPYGGAPQLVVGGRVPDWLRSVPLATAWLHLVTEPTAA